jgi:hypothetical protein
MDTLKPPGIIEKWPKNRGHDATAPKKADAA